MEELKLKHKRKARLSELKLKYKKLKFEPEKLKPKKSAKGNYRGGFSKEFYDEVLKTNKRVGNIKTDETMMKKWNVDEGDINAIYEMDQRGGKTFRESFYKQHPEQRPILRIKRKKRKSALSIPKRKPVLSIPEWKKEFDIDKDTPYDEMVEAYKRYLETRR